MRIRLLCPVLLAISCGSGDGPAPARQTGEDPVLLMPGAPAVFTAMEASSDTVWASWDGRGPLRLETVEVESGDSVSTGDTLATGIDSLVSIELEQVLMSLAFEEAGGGDPSGADSMLIDSLTELAGDLQESRNAAVVSPSPGSVGAGLPAPGAVLMPGTRLVPVVTSPENTFVLSAPEGVQVFDWPGTAAGASLVEAGADTALYSGASAAGDFVFPGSVSVPRQALMDDGLGAYVMLADSSAVGVIRICISGESITVLPDRPLEGVRILGWAPAGEGI